MDKDLTSFWLAWRKTCAIRTCCSEASLSLHNRQCKTASDRIAEPEKALCDQLYTMPPVPNTQELFRLLTEDLRIEESEIGKLDGNKICEYSGAYHTTNIKKLCSLLRRL